MTEADNIRLTVEGLIRNYGREAVCEAERIARRCVRKRQEASQIFWASIVQHLREIQGGPPSRPA